MVTAVLMGAEVMVHHSNTYHSKFISKHSIDFVYFFSSFHFLCEFLLTDLKLLLLLHHCQIYEWLFEPEASLKQLWLVLFISGAQNCEA